MPTKLRIGLVLDDSLDSTDGVQQYVTTLGSWLTSQGHEVHYLVGQTKRQDIPNVHSLARNIQVRYNGNRLSIPLPVSKRYLRTILKKLALDVLHVQTPYSPFMGGRLMAVAGNQTAVVGTFHIMAYDKAVVVANRLLAILNRQTAERFSTMIANSPPAATFAQTVYGFTPCIIANPFPLQKFLQTTYHPNQVPTIVFLGRLVPRKGCLQLLQAVEYVHSHNLFTEPFRVVIGGKGPLLARLQAYVRDHNLDDTVDFRGYVAESEKTAFLAAADIAVFPSVAGESFGISLLEALAAAQGVVLGGDNPGYRSVLAPLGENHLIQPNDTAAFAQEIAHWLIDVPARTNMRAVQQAYVKQYDIGPIGRQIEIVYNEALRLRRNVQ